jgi:hypothetical protein
MALAVPQRRQMSAAPAVQPTAALLPPKCPRFARRVSATAPTDMPPCPRWLGSNRRTPASSSSCRRMTPCMPLSLTTSRSPAQTIHLPTGSTSSDASGCVEQARAPRFAREHCAPCQTAQPSSRQTKEMFRAYQVPHRPCGSARVRPGRRGVGLHRQQRKDQLLLPWLGVLHPRLALLRLLLGRLGVLLPRFAVLCVVGEGRELLRRVLLPGRPLLSRPLLRGVAQAR